MSEDTLLNARELSLCVTLLKQSRDSCTAIGCGARALVIGTKRGLVHVLVNGALVYSFRQHHGPVVDISVADHDGTIVTTSVDSRIVVISLNDDDSHTQEVHTFSVENQPMLSVSLSPVFESEALQFAFVSKSIGPSIVKKSFFGSSPTVISDFPAQLIRVSPSTGKDSRYVAWISPAGVYAYDVGKRSMICGIEYSGKGLVEAVVSLVWRSKDVLLVGLGDLIQVLRVTAHGFKTLASFSLPRHMVWGIAPWNSFVVALISKKRSKAKNSPPRSSVIQVDPSNEWFSDLSDEADLSELLNDSPNDKRAPFLVATDVPTVDVADHPDEDEEETTELAIALINYSGKVIVELPVVRAPSKSFLESPPKLAYALARVKGVRTFYVSAGEHVFAVSIRQADCVLESLLMQNRLNDALEHALLYSRELKRFSLEAVAETYAMYLIGKHSYGGAASVLAKVRNASPDYWTKWIREFGAIGQIAALAPELPCSNPTLPTSVYMDILLRLVDTPEDHDVFLMVIRDWPSKIMDVKTLISHVERRNQDRQSDALLESLTKLYMMGGDYTTAINRYNRIREGIMGDSKDNLLEKQ